MTVPAKTTDCREFFLRFMSHFSLQFILKNEYYLTFRAWSDVPMIFESCLGYLS